MENDWVYFTVLLVEPFIAWLSIIPIASVISLFLTLLLHVFQCMPLYIQLSTLVIVVVVTALHMK